MTRGERNFNPFNLRLSAIPWLGKIASVDKSFEQFSNATYGIRAGFMDLHNQDKHGCNTILAIITRYAPSNENNTEAYVDAVCKSTGLDKNTELDLYSKSVLFKLGKAIITHENGGCIYTDVQLNEALALIDGLSV